MIFDVIIVQRYKYNNNEQLTYLQLSSILYFLNKKSTNITFIYINKIIVYINKQL